MQTIQRSEKSAKKSDVACTAVYYCSPPVYIFSGIVDARADFLFTFSTLSRVYPCTELIAADASSVYT